MRQHINYFFLFSQMRISLDGDAPDDDRRLGIALLQARRQQPTGDFYDALRSETAEEPTLHTALQDRICRTIGSQEGTHQDAGVKHGAQHLSDAVL
jgi:hypothetical protein